LTSTRPGSLSKQRTWEGGPVVAGWGRYIRGVTQIMDGLHEFKNVLDWNETSDCWIVVASGCWWFVRTQVSGVGPLSGYWRHKCSGVMLVNSSEFRVTDFPLAEVRPLQLDAVARGGRRTSAAVVRNLQGVGNSTFALSVENDNDFRSRCEWTFRHFGSVKSYFSKFFEKKNEKKSKKEMSWCLQAFIYYESIKRRLKRRLIYEYRCDERLKTKNEESTRLSDTGLVVELEHLKTKTRLKDLRLIHGLIALTELLRLLKKTVSFLMSL
jgi:hypothetical protein